MRHLICLFGSSVLVLGAFVPVADAWDYEGHRAVNQIALASLPGDFPAFVRDSGNAERIAWLSSEPDRWRSSPDLPARHCNAPDHYLNVETLFLAGLDPATMSSFRFEFAAQFAAGRAAHPQNFPAVDPAQNSDRTREWPGFLPWTITEYFGRLRGNFARLKVLEELGSEDEIAQTRASIVEMMGTMGHFVGDGAQPLHTTIHHNGWVGENPRGYTTWRGFHSWIDSGFIVRAKLDLGTLVARVRPAQVISLEARAPGRDPMFQQVVEYLGRQFALVEPLYQLEQAEKLRVEDRSPDAEAVGFIERQVLVAGEMLGRIWLTAWRTSSPDPYLRAQLIRQRLEPARPTPAE